MPNRRLTTCGAVSHGRKCAHEKRGPEPTSFVILATLMLIELGYAALVGAIGAITWQVDCTRGSARSGFLKTRLIAERWRSGQPNAIAMESFSCPAFIRGIANSALPARAAA